MISLSRLCTQESSKKSKVRTYLQSCLSIHAKIILVLRPAGLGGGGFGGRGDGGLDRESPTQPCEAGRKDEAMNTVWYGLMYSNVWM